MDVKQDAWKAVTVPFLEGFLNAQDEAQPKNEGSPYRVEIP